MRPSTGSVGDAYDNAMAESLVSTLEAELLSRRRFVSQAEARMACFSYSAFGRAIAENICEYLGLRINTHAFRCIAGALILEANPRAIDDVRALLGHSSFATVMRYYRRFKIVPHRVV